MNAISRLSTEELESFLMTVPDEQLPTEFIKARDEQIPKQESSQEVEDYSYLGNSVADTTTKEGPTFDWMGAMNEPTESSDSYDWLSGGIESTESGIKSFEIKENLNKKGEGQLNLKSPKMKEEKDRTPTVFADNSDVPYQMNDANNV